MKEDQAAIKIQSVFRGYLFRKKKTFGKSAGKEIEIYLPIGIKKSNSSTISYDNIPGAGADTFICESELFSIKRDVMRFTSHCEKLEIPEIVTAPFRQHGEINTNLPTEEEIDTAIYDLLSIIENFTQQAAQTNQVSYLPLRQLLQEYNQKHGKHPLRIPTYFKKMLNEPRDMLYFFQKYSYGSKINSKKLTSDSNAELCLVYDHKVEPIFNKSDTPRTLDASRVITENKYQTGELLVHIQKTFSFPVEEYKPGLLSEDFHLTEQQKDFLKEARNRSENFIDKHPLPTTANKEKILGLLTICAEHVITVTKSKEYVDLHERADRPALVSRHLLHYIKKNVCNDVELKWFDEMFKNHQEDIQRILCVDHYEPDYKGKDGAYGSSDSNGWKNARYDVIFDLFGDFANQYALTVVDKDYLPEKQYLKMKEYGITSWKKMFSNYQFLLGRNIYFNLQMVKGENKKNEYEVLAEARRIGLMTIEEYGQSKSGISLSNRNKRGTL